MQYELKSQVLPLRTALADLNGALLPAGGVQLDGAAWSAVPFPEGKLLKFAPVAQA